MNTEQDAQPTGNESRVLMLPLTRREATLALYAAASTKKRKDLPESAWTRITLADGALDD